jgi:sensor histidine kinase YesM
VCVQYKQPRKLHNAAEARNLAPLDLIHSDLCEMNEILTKGGKRYFITFIDDSTRFCYVYLLKSKYEALHYFKTYKAKVENQLERKIKRLRLIVVENIFQVIFLIFLWNTVLFMRGHRHTHHNPMGFLRERTIL